MLRQLATAPSRAARLAPRSAAQLSSFVAASAATPLRTTAVAAATRAPTFALRSRQAAVSASARWYSSGSDAKPKDESASKEGEGAPAEETSAEPLSGPEAAALRKELEAKSKEALEWKDQYLRSVADFRNLQERTVRDMKSAKDFAITQFAKDLVESVDNFDRALAMVPETLRETAGEAAAAAEKEPSAADIANLVDGLRMTESILMKTLKKHGLERFDPVGDKFDPNEQEATFMTPVKDKEHNTVFHTQQKGFKLNGRVLRAAKVGVVNNK